MPTDVLDQFDAVFGRRRGVRGRERISDGASPESRLEAEEDEILAQEEVNQAALEDRLDLHLSKALDALGVDEDRGDFWDIVHDGGDHYECSAMVDDKEINFDIDADGWYPG